jgi:putative glutamine amidotransferase
MEIMSNPLIGVTTRGITEPKFQIPMTASPSSYIQALSRAGAMPVLVPLEFPLERLESLLHRLDGFMFTGGGDIETARFNGEVHPEVYDVDPLRDALEIELAKLIRQLKMPFLAICRGCQLVNVAFGGTLYTHILDQLPGALQHSSPDELPFSHIAHTVTVRPGSLLAEIVGVEPLEVNSLHHQGVKDVADGFEVTAKAPDDLVEALEIPEYPFGLAVQWHPEWMPESPAMQAIFNAFVRAAARE